MKKIKVLNLYCGIGGNRLGWKMYDDIIDVDAVEIDEKIASIYKKQFPNDNVIIADAHEYLIEHFREYDFIWTSCPCVSHSKIRKMLSIKKRKDGTTYEQNKPIYPDMRLYQEIILLDKYFDGFYCCENVIPYYEPLIEPQKLGRHLFWSNMILPQQKFDARGSFDDPSKMLEKMGFDKNIYDGVKGVDKTKTMRNCLEPEISKYIFMQFLKNKEVNENA